MKTLPLIATLIAVSLFPYCRNSRYTPKDYPKRQILFGSGGGISGEKTEYILLENGFVFKGKGLVDLEHSKVGRIPVEEVSQIFTNYETLQLGEMDYNEPGNQYYYFEKKEPDSQHRISWGINRKATPKNVQLFYDLLKHTVENL